jgi:hypothetical protein
MYIVCTSSHQKAFLHPPTYPDSHPPIHPSTFLTRDGTVLTADEWMIERRASVKYLPEDILRELFYNTKAHFSGFCWTPHHKRLRHHVTSWKVACSIAYEVIWFFSWPNISNRAVAIESTQPITNMSARNLPEGNARPALKGDYLTAICEPVVKKNVEPRCFTNLWASTACYRDSFTLVFLVSERKWKQCTNIYCSLRVPRNFWPTSES